MDAIQSGRCCQNISGKQRQSNAKAITNIDAKSVATADSAAKVYAALQFPVPPPRSRLEWRSDVLEARHIGAHGDQGTTLLPRIVEAKRSKERQQRYPKTPGPAERI